MEELLFGDIVVVENNLIGVVVKTWIRRKDNNIIRVYEIYVRNFNEIKEYEDKDVKRYRVRHKYLDKEDLSYQNNDDYEFMKKINELRI